jgi:hypothetical protein
LNKEEIQRLLVEKTSFLMKFGYDKMFKIGDNWNFTLSYLSFKQEIAIEFEIDFREIDVFVLITILQKGKLPNGYYMEKGKKVKFHLEELIEHGKIKVGDWKEITRLRTELNSLPEHKILTLIDAYCVLLKSIATELKQSDVKVLRYM